MQVVSPAGQFTVLQLELSEVTVKPRSSNSEVINMLIKETSHQMVEPIRVYSNCIISPSLGVVEIFIETPPPSELVSQFST